TGLTFAIDGFASLSGDFTFVSVPGAIRVSGTNVAASLGAGGVAVTLSNASFALALFDDGSYALDASGDAALTGVPSVTLSGNLTVWANTTGSQTVDFGDYGVVDYGSAADVFAFQGLNLSLSVAGFVTLSGSMAFAVSGGELLAAGENLSAGLEISN
ncbi:hypothetical protein RZS08_15005, partial [Arthrospira platensis SPKY1]|nr:hypothetical protein [Arthrospira platensis SPKY1]